ncbi:DUF3833 domain-containing protein [Alteromonas confluentis]|uniref:DUF3833 domain-containing protein n=1 Tax=Alteromonas confluentis TaxID=1656094 RepID=A0A1E7ZCM8_9ALTE|nr:DUF3833 domain-containing protein [Alteromonas confluentis]OFC71259.1 hypothetical protein BFC18_08860 [Alteromonas confluentis]
MKKFAMLAAAALLMGSLTGCAGSVQSDAYTNQQPKFDLYDFFDGKVKAWGIVQNRSGEVVQRFIVDIDARHDGDTLILDESFNYQLGDGVKNRTWRITPTGNNTFAGEAGDILGTAKGTSYGNAFNFAYSMDLPVDDTTYEVAFDDWFFGMSEDTMMNRSYIKKFGITMAEVTIFMQKQ